MAMIASLRQRPTGVPSSSSSSSSTSSTIPLKPSAATTTAVLQNQQRPFQAQSPLSETQSTNPTTPKTQFSATKNDTPSSSTDHINDENEDIDNNYNITNNADNSGSDNRGGDGSFLELDCNDILQDMQETLDNSLQKTTETWRFTKATANEKIREVEHQVAETWDIASKAAIEGAKRLLRFEELPKEWQSNPYILTGYRFLSSKRQCLKSIFRIHNETCNIWTHMLGTLGLIILGLHIHISVLFLGKTSTTTTLYDHAVFLLFFIAASECLISSTLYHTFLCHSRLTVMRCAATFDYIGIGVLITASVMATLHYGFFCDTTERWMFMSFSGGMGVIGCIIPFYPKFDLPSFRYFRIFIFLGMACSGIIPLTYAGLQKGWWNTWKFIQPFCKSGLAYLTGLVFYGHRFPERQFPGWFDRWGHSHQLWHVAVVAGIYFHYLAMAQFFEARYSFGCLAVYGGYDHPSLHS